jgi:hypothetical protein
MSAPYVAVFRNRQSGDWLVQSTAIHPEGGRRFYGPSVPVTSTDLPQLGRAIVDGLDKYASQPYDDDLLVRTTNGEQAAFDRAHSGVMVERFGGRRLRVTLLKPGSTGQIINSLRPETVAERVCAVLGGQRWRFKSDLTALNEPNSRRRRTKRSS